VLGSVPGWAAPSSQVWKAREDSEAALKSRLPKTPEPELPEEPGEPGLPGQPGLPEEPELPKSPATTGAAPAQLAVGRERVGLS